VISELDIFRAANLLIDRHGGDAVVEAAQMIDRMLELGDPEGRQLWRRIKRAIEQLQAGADCRSLSGGGGSGLNSRNFGPAGVRNGQGYCERW
jgi:hypothetical protein